ncbi:MAG: efflux RND transporter periplasmic adaptor subunit [Chloroflexota bacterium]|nr:efflux RND transporter periplasmic adaptor subunit [Chloroflexota bacterium]
MKKSKKKWYIIGVVVIILAGAAGFFVIRGNQQKADVRANYQTERVERGELVSIIGATGDVRARQSAIITWKTSGSVEDVTVGLGDTVSAGEMLASLEQTSLPQSLISTQSELVSANQALSNLLDSDLQSAQALQAVEDAEQALEDAQNPKLARATAQKAVADAVKALDEAEHQLYNVLNPINEEYVALVNQRSLDGVMENLSAATEDLENAWIAYQLVENKPFDDPEKSAARKALDDAQWAYTLAYWKFNELHEGGEGDEDDFDDPTDSDNEIDYIELPIVLGEVAIAQANLAEAEKEWERVKDGTTPGDFATLEARLADAKREWGRLQDGPDPDDVLAAEARVAAAEAALESAELKSPFDGTITQADVLPSDQVNAGTVAFRIDDLSFMYSDIQVSEVDINKMEVGQDVTLTFDAILAQEYHGTVVSIDLAGNEVQGVVNFTVTVEMTDADAQVRPGMTVAANIVVNELEDVLLVPNRAVRVQDGKRIVYVLRLSGPEMVEIELGASSDMYSEVIGGDLKKGDEIILNPSSEFEPHSSGRPF